MDKATYRTGQAARILNVSSHQIRRLCETGMIEAELTPGNRWRIAAGEVERLKREGVPPIPQIEPVPVRDVAPASREQEDRRNRDEEPSQCGLTPQVQAEADSLAIAERRLKRRKIELEQDEVEDSFRERERRRRAEREAKEQAAAEDHARRQRKRWLEIWVVFALARLKQHFFPYTAVPGESSLELHSEVERTLRDLTPDHSEDMVILLVDACVQKVAAPYQRRTEVQKAIDAALADLPCEARWSAEWQTKAKQAAVQAVAKLDAAASCRDIQNAAFAAIAPIAAECTHRKLQQDMAAEWYWDGYWSATENDREEARELVRIALETAPVGSSREQFRQLREKATAPIAQRIKETGRKEAARRNAIETVRAQLYRVDSYMRENCDSVGYFERARVAQEFKQELEPIIAARLLDGRLSAGSVPAFIDRWLDEELEDEGDDELEDYDEVEDDEEEDD